MKPILMIAAIALAGCGQRDEAACYQSLSDQLDTYADDAIAKGQYETALTAIQSAREVVAITIDDDRNACDYVSAGPYLERK